MSKLVAIRADGAPFMGIGHIMRCLTLADVLKKQGWKTIFISRAFETNFCQAIKNAGHELRQLPPPSKKPVQAPDLTLKPPHATWLGEDWEQDAQQTLSALEDVEMLDLLIVDHYGLDARWQKTLRSKAQRILVIDDLADRPLDCDFLLDQTFGRNPDDYASLTPEHATRLCGSDYMLLRDEFSTLRNTALKKRQASDTIRNILITMGSADPDNVTKTVLEGLENIDEPLDIHILLSSKAVHLDEVKSIAGAASHNVEILQDCGTVAEQMLWADLAYGAGGTTSWERCCLALPSCLISIAENQNMISEKLDEAGAVNFLGAKESLRPEDVEKSYRDISVNSEAYQALCEKSAVICDGLGTGRVIAIIEDSLKADNRQAL